MKSGLVDRLVASAKILGREEHLQKMLLGEITTNTSMAEMQKKRLREPFLKPKTDDSKERKVATSVEYFRSLRERYQWHRSVVRRSRQELRMVQSSIKNAEAQIARTIQQLDNRP